MIIIIVVHRSEVFDSTGQREQHVGRIVSRRVWTCDGGSMFQVQNPRCPLLLFPYYRLGLSHPR